MNKKIIAGRAVLLAAALASLPAFAQEAQNLDQLLQRVREAGQQLSQENRTREQEFLRNRNEQRNLLNQARQGLAAEEGRSNRLKAQFEQNEKLLAELQETLNVRVGNFGELFGVVRQVAGDTKGVIDNSLISAQFDNRGQIANKLAQIKGLPSITDLRSLWALLQEEMTESGKVVRFRDTIVQPDGTTSEAEVVRVGVYNAITGDQFLRHEADTNRLQVLPRQPAGRYRSLARDLFDAPQGETVAMAVDPSRGQLLGLLINTPGLGERVQQGGIVGYVILGLLALGILIAFERWFFLTKEGAKIRRQLKSERADNGNALGRILGVYHENKDIDTETLELKLDEAILKETPQLEKRQGIIKVFAAVAPLLGLLGTVVGMIITFQAITLFGTGDPKLMAGGISTALITTVQGLITAIPLVLLHSVISGKSKSLIEILEEQSAGLIARHSESDVG